MNKIFTIYLSIGGLLAVPMSLSYIYAEWFILINMGWQIFSVSGLMMLLTAGWLIFITPIIRSFIWLPSLVMWFYNDGGQYYSFFQWLAPGFYIEFVG